MLIEGKLTAGQEMKEQGEKGNMIESFRNFSPTLYKVLTDKDSSVKAIKDFKIDGIILDVMTLTTADIAKDINDLVHTCMGLCKKINSTHRLAILRRYLCSVWLHV